MLVDHDPMHPHVWLLDHEGLLTVIACDNCGAVYQATGRAGDQ